VIPAFDNAFLQLEADEELWLDRWYAEGAKELTVEALLVSIDLVLPASSEPAPSPGSEGRSPGGRDWSEHEPVPDPRSSG
jgi:hypothetical protein